MNPPSDNCIFPSSKLIVIPWSGPLSIRHLLISFIKGNQVCGSLKFKFLSSFSFLPGKCNSTPTLPLSEGTNAKLTFEFFHWIHILFKSVSVELWFVDFSYDILTSPPLLSRHRFSILFACARDVFCLLDDSSASRLGKQFPKNE